MGGKEDRSNAMDQAGVTASAGGSSNMFMSYKGLSSEEDLCHAYHTALSLSRAFFLFFY